MTNPHTPQTDCPRADETLTRPLDELSDDWLAHMEDCATCQRALHEVTEMGRLARALPVPAWNAEQVAAGELRLLAALENGALASPVAESPASTGIGQGDSDSGGGDWVQQLPEVPERRRQVPAYVWALLAAALLLGFGMFLGRTTTPNPGEVDRNTPETTAAVHRASVHTDNARYALVSPQPNEIIRLYEGTITVSVEPLQPGERFRVITGDGEVEVHGTIFDVVVEEDSLASVRVHEGVVAVRPEDSAPTELRLGERWTPDAGTAGQLQEISGSPTPEPAVAAPAEPGTEPGADPLPSAQAQAQTLAQPQPPAEMHDRHDGRVVNPFEVSPDAHTARETVTNGVQPNRHAGTPPVQSASPSLLAPPTIPTGPDELAFQQGWELLQQGQASAAAAAFSQVGAGSAVAEDAAFWRGIALGRNRQLQASERALVEFTRRYPTSARVAEAWLAVGMIRLQDPGSDAREALERARDLGTGAVRARADEALQQLDATLPPD
jgi:TolA-binding protein